MLADWLRTHAPATAQGTPPAAMLALRAEVAAEHPHWAHDLSAIRLETIRRALRKHGDDPALAELAFEVFFEARHAVTLYDDVLPGLERLASRYRSSRSATATPRCIASGWSASSRARCRRACTAWPSRDPSIFVAACAAAGAAPHQVLHLGDDLVADVDGALAAGLHAGWICRPDGAHAREPPRAGAHRFANLLAVADALGV